MSRITLDQANAIIAGAFKARQDLGLKPLAVVVLDAGGHPLAYQRQDGVSSGRFQVATGKASGALFLGMSSRAIEEAAITRPVFVAAIGPISPSGVVPAAGGVIVVDETGGPIGAVGISGDTADNDEACALAGIAAAGLKAQG